MDKWKIHFYNSLGIKMVHADHVNEVLFGPQKQQNVPVEGFFHSKLEAAVYGLCTVAF